MTERISAPAKRKHPSESILYVISFDRILLTGETLSGTPTVTGSPSGLTIGSPSVISADFTDTDGTVVPANRGVQVRVSSGTANTDYNLTASCATSSGNTRVGVGPLMVRSS